MPFTIARRHYAGRRDVTLVALAGKRIIYGFRQDVMGRLG